MLQPTERVFPSVCLVKCHLGHQTFENLLAQQISSEKERGGWQHPVSNAIFRVSCVVLISSRGKTLLGLCQRKISISPSCTFSFRTTKYQNCSKKSPFRQKRGMRRFRSFFNTLLCASFSHPISTTQKFWYPQMGTPGPQ